MSGFWSCVLVGIPALVFWVGLWVWLWRQVYHVEHAADEVHWARTEDGWRLALHRVKPATRRYREPLILCHGLGANRYNLDWPGQSLARYFAERGFDVFVPETRGAGLSERPRLFGAKRWDFTFDHLARYDVPAIIDRVREITGEARVLWLGHSMGGMIAYAHLGMTPDSPIRAAAVLGSPAAFESLGWARRISFLARVFPFLRVLHQNAFASLIAPLTQRLRPNAPHLMANAANMDPLLSRRLMVNLISDVSWPLMRHAALWVDSGQLLSADGTRDYLEGLRTVTTPMLITVGSADLISPLPSVKAAYDALKSEDKRFVCFDREHGFRDDYGHGDLVFGRNAPVDVFPVLEEWFTAHATVTD